MDYATVMMGEDAIHIPFNFIRQQADETHGLILGQETGINLAFGSKMSHVLVQGDMIFRPRLVIESNQLIGMGAAAIITSPAFSHVSEWDHPENRIILDKR